MNNSLLSDLLIILCSFARDFLANFLSDLLAGLILAVIVGYGVAWWVGKRLNELAGREQRKVEERARLEKTIHYLKLLGDEVYDLVAKIPDDIELLQKTERQAGALVVITPIWDILQPSGELPKLLDPHLLSSIALFYGQISVAQRGAYLTMQSWASPHPLRATKFARFACSAFEKALEFGDTLPGKLDSEIEVLEAQLATL